MLQRRPSAPAASSPNTYLCLYNLEPPGHTWTLRDPRCWVSVCARGRHCSWAPVTPSQGHCVAAAAEQTPCSVTTPPHSSHLPTSSTQVPRLGGTFRILSWGFLSFLHSESLCRTMYFHISNKRGKQRKPVILKYTEIQFIPCPHVLRPSLD